jgi:hypothetical protein
MKLAAATLLLVLLSGCLLADVRRNNQDLASVANLKGNLNGGSSEGKPRWAVLYKMLDGRWTRYSSLVFHKPGPFEFVCFSGRYLLFAFEDQNEDGVWQPDEPAARFGSKDGIQVVGGEPVEGVDITLGTLREPLGFEVALPRVDEPITEELVKIHAGDVTTLAEERFSPDSASLGMWQPADFARKWGVGLSFLEPYSPGKIPVLFIHGAGGSPRDFEQLIERLDHTRFQAWVVSYPSGIRIQLASLMVRQIADDLQQRLRFAKLYVVAHSMGGLVARDFVMQVVQRGEPMYVGLLLTMSTPWAGVALARSGVDRSPVVLPSWIDVAAGSTFLTILTEKPFPPSIPFYLFFGFEGGNGSDGTIALKSQLEPKTQRAAKQVFGFPDDHTAILLSAAVSEKLNALLADP